MRIGLIDVDGHNFPNIPLMKISAYHKKLGDTVEWWQPFEGYDRVYQSKVFSFTPDVMYPIQADEVIKGGSGYAITLQNGREVYTKENDSPLDPEIDAMCPDYSLYPQYSQAYGNLTRGCPRNCPFCIIGKKEGLCSKQVADLEGFYRGQKEIKLLDPNLLASRDHLRLLKQLADSKAYVDFTQGLDIRMCTDDNIDLINKIKLKQIHFAWDNPKQDLTDKFEFYLKRAKRKPHGSYAMVYVLTNYDSTLEEDLYRVYRLRELGFDPYVMIYNKQTAPKQIRDLQRYVNNKRIFRTVKDFQEYDNRKR